MSSLPPSRVTMRRARIDPVVGIVPSAANGAVVAAEAGGVEVAAIAGTLVKDLSAAMAQKPSRHKSGSNRLLRRPPTIGRPRVATQIRPLNSLSHRRTSALSRRAATKVSHRAVMTSNDRHRKQRPGRRRVVLKGSSSYGRLHPPTAQHTAPGETTRTLAAIAKMTEQAAGSLLSQVENVLESSRSPVIGIRHFIYPQVGRKFEEQPYALPILRRCASPQVRQVGAIHREDEIEARKILADDLACPQSAHVKPASARCHQGTLIGRLPDVPV